METTLISQPNGSIAKTLYRMLMHIYSRTKASPKQRNILQDAGQTDSDHNPRSIGSRKTVSAGEILTVIYRHHIDTRCLNIAVDGKSIVIDGIVESANEKDYIGAIVGAIPGVQKVKNLLKII